MKGFLNIFQSWDLILDLRRFLIILEIAEVLQNIS